MIARLCLNNRDIRTYKSDIPIVIANTSRNGRCRRPDVDSRGHAEGQGAPSRSVPAGPGRARRRAEGGEGAPVGGEPRRRRRIRRVHSAAALLADLGVPDIAAAAGLGHTQVQVTQGYQHVMVARLQEVGEALGEVRAG